MSVHTLAICGADIASMNPDNDSFATVEVGGTSVTAGLLSIPEPPFEPDSDAHRSSVLVRTEAFSCNYREIGLIISVLAILPPDRFYSIGSEFVGTVVAIGDDVDGLAVGDRVIPDGSYPGGADRRGGLPTNHGSRQLQVIDHNKLIAVPASMEPAVAASFTIGAQTSYSMVRRLGAQAGDEALVTAGRSNTSLFAIRALRNAGCRITALTTAPDWVADLRAVGADEVHVVDPTVRSYSLVPEIAKYVEERGGFHVVVDPFFDVNLDRVVALMRPGGRYITCGLADQYSVLTGAEVPHAQDGSMRDVMSTAMLHNLQLIGNCLGSVDDLRRALADHLGGRLDVTIDSVHGDGNVGTFLDRTFNAADRFGKVVYRYPS